MSAITRIVAVGVVGASVGLGIGVGLNMSQPATLLLGGCVVGVILATVSAAMAKHGAPPAEPPPTQITYNDFRVIVAPSPLDSPGRQSARAMLEAATGDTQESDD